MKERYDFSTGVRGPVLPAKGKSRITILLDDDILTAFREQASVQGKGYQTLINQTLRQAIAQNGAPITENVLRRILREELQHA